MKLQYGQVKALFRQHRIRFNWTHTDRHRDTDLLDMPEQAVIEPDTAFTVGNGMCSMGAFSYAISALPGFMQVGRYCSIAKGLSVLGTRHPVEWASTSPFTYNPRFIHAHPDFRGARRAPQPRRDLRLGHDVWIGGNVTLATDVHIGTGAVVAANSLVLKSVKPYEIVGGSPARHIRFRFPEPVIELLLASRWWECHFKDFDGIDFTDPAAFAETVLALRERGEISAYQPEALDLAKIRSVL